MLKDTRFKSHFDVTEPGMHKGLFDCSVNPKKKKYDVFGQEIVEEKSGSSCC